MIFFDSTICTDLDAASSREWLETNGIGGFASGSVSGSNTRRYHGLLTAATDPPLGRITMLSKLEETLVIEGSSYDLGANHYPGPHIHPQGFRFIKSFRLDPFPVWVFEVDGVELEKKVFMVYGENTVVCTWKVKRLRRGDRRPISLEVRPLVSFVDYHHLRREDPARTPKCVYDDASISVSSAEDLPPMHFVHSGGNVRETGYWYRDFEYSIERERGFDYREDLFQPFAVTFENVRTVSLIASAERPLISDTVKLERSEIKRRKALVKLAGVRDDVTKQLVLAADQFIVSRGAGHTIIAGYPWFSDWGRDTMISLTGLTLATNRPEIARGIILEFSKHISEGMLPNRFPDAGGEAEYNTVDATLWYFEAVRAYLAATGDVATVRDHIYGKLAEIVAWHLKGTRYNIHVDTDGLLYAGEAGVQLTWMDAKIGDLVVTPRIGKPVEVQALWYNALCIMVDLAERFGDAEDQARYAAMADLAKLSFNALFWNDAEQCLYDVVENGTRDGSIRPNQIFAVSLQHSMIDADRAKMIVEKVEHELLTPVGLRSLSASDEKYVPIYIGSPFDRDSSYHQGTVWAWLIGPFIDAYRRVYPNAEKRVAEILSGFENHMTEAGLGQISEIFDADPPHLPRGCFAQAWSVAEVLRVSVKSS